jgi:hypothetical protein
MWNAVTVIIGISVIMWILSSLFSTRESPKPEPRRTEPRKPPASRPRSTASDIDRFLEEVNRRRQQAAGKEKTETPPVPTVLPAKPRRPKPPRAETPAKRPLNPPAVRREVPVEVVAVVPSKPSSTPSRNASERAEMPAAIVVVEEKPSPAPTVPPVVARRPLSPALASLVPLLTSRDQLRSALLLPEILGQPRCRQPLK